MSIQILKEILDKLRGYLNEIKRFQKYSFEEFEQKIEINWALDRGLQLIIESSIDAGKEIITTFNFRKPTTYAQVFQILSQHKIIQSYLAEEMQRLSNFRNELVHDYLYLDPKKIYDVFRNDLTYFEQYLLEVEKFIKEKMD